MVVRGYWLPFFLLPEVPLPFFPDNYFMLLFFLPAHFSLPSFPVAQFSVSVISDINFCCHFSYPLIFRCRMFRSLNFPVSQSSVGRFLSVATFSVALFTVAVFTFYPNFTF